MSEVKQLETMEEFEMMLTVGRLQAKHWPGVNGVWELTEEGWRLRVHDLTLDGATVKPVEQVYEMGKTESEIEAYLMTHKIEVKAVARVPDAHNYGPIQGIIED